ncbi:MAG: hypothetical protein ACODAF_10380 [Actinomycetota bacterium]
MRLRAAMAAVLGGALLAGCVSMPESRTAEPQGKIAVTQQQAVQVYERYDQVNNEASAKRDADAAATVQADPVLQTSRTSYRLAEASDEEPPDPFYHTGVRAFSPRFEEYPMWFVAVSRVNDNAEQVAVQVLGRESATSEWLVEQSAMLGAAELPGIRRVDGAIADVTGEQAAAVEGVLGRVYEYLAGGEAPEDLDLALDGLESYRTWSQDSTIQLEEVTDPSISCATDDRAEVRVLPTEDGVLGVATARCALEQSLREDVSGEMTLGGDLSALAPEEGRRVEFVSSHPLVVSVPDDGPVEVFSGGWRWADVTMSGGGDDDG